MLYCVQFKRLRKKMERFESNPLAHGDEIDKAYERGKKLARLRYLYKKSFIVLKRMRMH